MKQHFGLVGSRFRPNGIQLVNAMADEHPVLMVREPDNLHDPNAIAVYVQIGYVPANQAAYWASQLDTQAGLPAVKAKLKYRRTIEIEVPDKPHIAATLEDPPPTEKDSPFYDEER